MKSTMSIHQKINLKSHFSPNRNMLKRALIPYDLEVLDDWRDKYQYPYYSEINCVVHHSLDKNCKFNDKK